MKTTHLSFEEKIKKTFTNYARLLTVILFALLLLFIGFERVLMPYITANRTSQSIKGKIQKMSLNVSNIIQELDGVASNDQFYRVYYNLFIGQGLKGDIMIYDEHQNILFMTNSANEGSYINKLYNQLFIEQMKKSPAHQMSGSVNRSSGTEALNDVVYGEIITLNDGTSGYAIITISSDILRGFVQESVSHHVVLTDSYNYVVARSAPGLSDHYNRFNVSQETDFQLNDKVYHVSDSEIDYPNLVVHILTPQEPLLSLLAYAGILLVVVLWIHQYTSTKVAERVGQEASASIDKLQTVFDRIAQGDLGTTIKLDTQDEFETLATAFNTMSTALEQSVIRNQSLLELQKAAEIKQLEAQFNPHFLYNSLETIRYLIASDPSLAEHLILSNTRLLRYSIESSHELVDFGKDFEYIELYLNIHKIRLGDDLTIDIHIDAALFDEMLPKLLIQPLIENSIKHGYRHQEKLHIRIDGWMSDDNLVLKISDNGSGMDELTLQQFQHHDKAKQNSGVHYGLYSIHHRLHLIYHGLAGMDLTSHAQGTTITLTIPRRQTHV